MGDCGGPAHFVGVIIVKKRKNRWYRHASPQLIYPVIARVVPWFAVTSAVLFIAGMWMALFIAPTDFQQGDAYRVLFIHVPAAWMGMFLYILMAAYAIVGWAFNTRISSMMATSLASTGAMFTGLSLVTGSFWGRPAWGTWWVWDARTTSTLILLFLYTGFIALQSAIDDPQRSDRASALLAIIGVVNVPIIYFSVQWWNTLHQGATIRFVSRSTISPSMLIPMLILLVACWTYSVAIVLARLRCVIAEREKGAGWLQIEERPI
jgi:heme exporter protein C